MAALPELESVEPLTLARDQIVPTLEPLHRLFPTGGLARGSLVGVTSRAGGARSLALALSAAATQQGGWAVYVGLPGLDLTAGAELGVALERVAVVDRPAPDQWGTVVAALVGAFDVVVTGAPPRVRAADVRRLQARARERGSVLVVVGGNRAAEGLHREADLRLLVDESRWHGLGHGHGHIQARSVVITAGGRRGAARPRRLALWLPAADGQVRLVEEEAPSHHHAGADIDDLVIDDLDIDDLVVEADIVPFPSSA